MTAEGQAELVSPIMDLMGFTVAGDGHFLASGHPGRRVDLPPVRDASAWIPPELEARA